MAVFGVDFGTLNSVVSVARRGGVDVIVNDVSKRETASIVSFGEKERYIGEKGLDQVIRNWKNTVINLKRLIGVHYDSALARHEFKFLKAESRADPEGYIEFRVKYKFEDRWFRPEQLVGMLFTQLRKFAEAELAPEGIKQGELRVQDCVVSVPIYFTSTQRRLLFQALQIAGLNPLNILNETTAAALDYGIYKSTSLPEKEEEGAVVAIADLGQSATTITVVSFTKGQLKVLGHVFDPFLGGRDFDLTLYEHYAQQVLQKYKCDLREDKKGSLKLLAACERFKKVLSANAVANLSCEMNDFDVNIQNVPREEIEPLWTPLVQRVKELVERAKQIPTPRPLTSVEVIGGTSRIPCVKQALAEGFGLPLSTTLNASESIAKGCGIMGAMLSPKYKVREFAVVDSSVYGINLGYHSDKTKEPISDPNFPEINKRMAVFRPGDACPKTLNLTFDRSADFDMFVFYEPHPEVQSVGPELLIGKWRVAGIPASIPDPSVKVRLRLSPAMLLNVEGATVTEEVEVEVEEEVEEPAPAPAAEGEAPGAPVKVKKLVKKTQTKKHECAVTILKSTGNTQDRLTELKQQEQQMVQSDRNVALTLEAKNAVEAYIYEMRTKVQSDGKLGPFISAEKREQFLQAMERAEEWLYGDGEDTSKEDYQQKLTELKAFGEPAAQRLAEHEAIAPAAQLLNGRIAALREKALNNDGSRSHIPAEELRSVVDRCDQAQEWVREQVGRHNAQSRHLAAAVTAAQIQAKQRDLETFANPILDKPKPKPAAADPAAAAASTAEKKADEAAPSDAEGSKPNEPKMDLD